MPAAHRHRTGRSQRHRNRQLRALHRQLTTIRRELEQVIWTIPDEYVDELVEALSHDIRYAKAELARITDDGTLRLAA